MSPQVDSRSQLRPPHAQRPWRPVEHEQRRPALRVSARTYCAAVARELPPRHERRAVPGTW
jgi:hypothetical protein